MAVAVFGRLLGFDRLWESFQEFLDRDFLVYVNRRGIRPDERPAENAGGPVGDVVPLELFEQRQLDLRLLRDGCESYILLFTLEPKSSAEILRHTSEFASESTMTRALLRSKFDAFF